MSVRNVFVIRSLRFSLNYYLNDRWALCLVIKNSGKSLQIVFNYTKTCELENILK